MCFAVIFVLQITSGQIVHYMGAGMLFLFGTMYSATGTIIAKQCYKEKNTRKSLCLFVTRLGIAIIMFTSLAIRKSSIILSNPHAYLRVQDAYKSLICLNFT